MIIGVAATSNSWHEAGINAIRFGRVCNEEPRGMVPNMLLGTVS